MGSLLSIHHGLDDRDLVERAAAVIGVPRAEVIGSSRSFVLHAPLELLARAALLRHVRPGARDQARARIAMLADLYADSGPSCPPPRPAAFDSLAAAAEALIRAAQEGDVGTTDAAAAWLGDRARASELTSLLGAAFLPTLEAAGHANIYLSLLGRATQGDLPQQMLRHPANAVVSSNPRSIPMPAAPSAARPARPDLEGLLSAVQATEPIGPPADDGIASLVEHARFNDVLEPLTGDGSVRHGQSSTFRLLRFAAHAMLQGNPDHARYGWTHCLTLAHAPLSMVADGADERAAAYVSAVYLAAHWSTLGHGTVDMDHVPEPASVGLTDALDVGPAVAAAAAWHATDLSEVAATLASVAAVEHDAHRVKYTLACLDAAAVDRPATRLYLAAAAHLNAQWQIAPAEIDPMSDLASAGVTRRRTRPLSPR